MGRTEVGVGGLGPGWGHPGLNWKQSRKGALESASHFLKENFQKKKKKKIFLFQLCWVFIALRTFSLAVVSRVYSPVVVKRGGLLSNGSVQASHCSGFLLQSMGARARIFISWGPQAL